MRKDAERLVAKMRSVAETNPMGLSYREETIGKTNAFCLDSREDGFVALYENRGRTAVMIYHQASGDREWVTKRDAYFWINAFTRGIKF